MEQPSPEVLHIVQDLVLAVENVMNAATPPSQRNEAHRACEEFKETSPHCVQCGLLMAHQNQNHFIRHFGLQLLEHCVKYRWNKMEPTEKVFLKDKTMEMLARGTSDLLTEKAHIKDGLSRIVVEMVKREWPQHWPNMQEELNQLCLMGPTQTELVLMVFLRLAEDVLLLQTVPNQRRRDIMTALTSSMPNLFAYFLNTLQSTYQAYISLKTATDDGSKQDLQINCRVAVAVINTIAAFMDWINMSFVTERDGLLLQLLCLMLSEESLQLPAAECLLIIVSRKGKIEDRKPLLILFSDDAMSTILNAALASFTSPLNEYHYVFLKRLCQLLTGIGGQLAGLWGACDGVSRPPNFMKYLEAILAFTQHPSQTLGSLSQTLWASFMKHEHISQDEVFLEIMPKLVQTSNTTLLKVGFPSQNNSPSCGYSRLEFDSDEDFHQFYSKYRAEIAETLRQATRILPMVTFQFFADWLKMLLKKPLNIGEGCESGHCNLTSPSFLEWDALTVILEGVMQRVTQTDQFAPPVDEGLQLLRDVLAYNTQDPLILSSVLSCVSALFPYITHAPDILPTVLDKIFSAALFSISGQTKATRSKAVKNVRRHACSVLVKICKQYPALLLPGFDQLYTHIMQLSSDPEQLSQMEKCTLIEALILINNEFKNFEKQCNFLEEILKPVKEMWLSEELKVALWSAEKFIAYVGLDQAPVEPSSEDTCGINRSKVIHCVKIILAVLKRSTWPQDMEVAKTGGFTVPDSSNGVLILRNPAMPHLMGMLGNVMALARTMNMMWVPEYLRMRHPAFGKAYDIPETDKQSILGIMPPCVDNMDSPICRQPVERMQSFLVTVHESCYHILGNTGQSFGAQFYQAPNLASSLVNSVFSNFDEIPDYRLKPILRVFMKMIVSCCPRESYQTVIVPLLSALCPLMQQRLTNKWKIIQERCEANVGKEEDEQDPESQEVLEEQILRQLNREYLDLLGSIFRERRGPASDTVDDVPMDEDAGQQTPHNASDSLSELGTLLLCTETLFPSLLLTVFCGLTARDSIVCNKSANYCWPIFKQLISSKSLTADDVRLLYTSVLEALQIHGQHESAQAGLVSLASQIYELSKPAFPVLGEVMVMIPGCTHDGVRSYDEKLFAGPNKVLSEKRKKEVFRKLISGVIGKNIGQQFKKPEAIRNLPPICRVPKRVPRLDEVENDDIGICALFQP